MRRHPTALTLGCIALLTSCGSESSLSPRPDGGVSNARPGSGDPSTSLYASPNNATQIGRTWLDNVSNESGWEIHRSTNGAGGTFTLRATLAAKSVSYVDDGLTPLTEYCYKVRSFKTSGPKTTYAAFYNTSCAKTYGPPPAVTGLNATPLYANSVNVVWTSDNSSTATGLRIEQAGSAAGPWSTLATLDLNRTWFSESGKPEEQLLCYRVVAVNYWGESPSNVDCTAHTAAPSNVAAGSNDLTSIDVTWQDNSGFEDGYEVIRGGGASTVVTNLGANVTSL